jgi:hypothetical protein
MLYRLIIVEQPEVNIGNRFAQGLEETGRRSAIHHLVVDG